LPADEYGSREKNREEFVGENNCDRSVGNFFLIRFVLQIFRLQWAKIFPGKKITFDQNFFLKKIFSGISSKLAKDFFF